MNNKRSKPLVLVADDDRSVREGLAARLHQAGFEVVSAADAPAAIDQFEQRHPDAAILDVQMPSSDGFSVCEHIRKGGSGIPVFFLTGAREGIISNHLPTLSRTVGGTHFVTKPYDGKTMVLLLRRAIDSSDLEAFAAAPRDASQGEST